MPKGFISLYYYFGIFLIPYKAIRFTIMLQNNIYYISLALNSKCVTPEDILLISKKYSTSNFKDVS